MNFLEFLNESAYKKDIDQEEAIKYIKEKCSLNYFYRGMSGDDDCYLLDGGSRERKSISDTGNYHNVIIDVNIFEKNRNYPRRSNSIICATQANKSWSKEFGNVYVVFPFKNAMCAYTKEYDLIRNYPVIGRNEHRYHFDHIAEIFKDCGIPDNDFDDMVAELESKRRSLSKDVDDGYELSEEDAKLYDVLNSIDGPIEDELLSAYSLKNMKIEFEKCESIDNSKMYELWFSDNCVAIKESLFRKIQNEIFEN